MSDGTRRALLVRGARLALGAALGVAGLRAGAGCARSGDPCAAPESLSTGEASLRASFHYSARSPHGDAKACRECSFFRTQGLGRGQEEKQAQGCGDCEILQGPVSGQGYCDSFSPRARVGRARSERVRSEGHA